MLLLAETESSHLRANLGYKQQKALSTSTRQLVDDSVAECVDTVKSLCYCALVKRGSNCDQQTIREECNVPSGVGRSMWIKQVRMEYLLFCRPGGGDDNDDE